jgi:hypothetical protein
MKFEFDARAPPSNGQTQIHQNSLPILSIYKKCVGLACKKSLSRGQLAPD